jgi:Type IV secretion-system coupling protein DNA-binding domain
MQARYGEDAEAMLSQPATKIFLRTTEPRAAKWVSEAIGEVEIERLRETHYEGSRAGRNFALDRQTEPLVPLAARIRPRLSRSASTSLAFNSWRTATFSSRREALSGETMSVFSGDST